MKYYIFEDDFKDEHLIDIGSLRFVSTKQVQDTWALLLLIGDQPVTVGAWLKSENVRAARSKMIKAAKSLSDNQVVE